MIRQQWETATRYYSASLQLNLFDEWEVMVAWGGKETRLGRVKVLPVASYESGLQRLVYLDNRRRKRGYFRYFMHE